MSRLDYLGDLYRRVSENFPHNNRGYYSRDDLRKVLGVVSEEIPEAVKETLGLPAQSELFTSQGKTIIRIRKRLPR